MVHKMFTIKQVLILSRAKASHDKASRLRTVTSWNKVGQRRKRFIQEIFAELRLSQDSF